VVEGLLPDAAILTINGQRKMLRVGQSHAGVTLVAAQQNVATLEIGGKRYETGLSRRVVTNYESVEAQVVSIARNERLQYKTRALVNGHPVDVLVDTGANIVAMSSQHARSMGIDYKEGAASQVQTASGLSPSNMVNLDSVEVGGIRVNNVSATVVKGDYPVTILLGMSYLQHVRMSEADGVLTLTRSE
jgi:aspartyl protease family protein